MKHTLLGEYFHHSCALQDEERKSRKITHGARFIKKEKKINCKENLQLIGIETGRGIAVLREVQA